MSLLPDQPREVARLLNPSFCAALLLRATEGFTESAKQPMHLVLAYMVLPIVLHEPTRSTLPRSSRTKFSTWILQNPQVRTGLPDRCHALLPFTSAGLSFLIKAKALDVRDRGFLTANGLRLRGATTYPNTTDEIARCWSRSMRIGQLFASVPRPARVLISLGVRL